jgi:hypothetical protein
MSDVSASRGIVYKQLACETPARYVSSRNLQARCNAALTWGGSGSSRMSIQTFHVRHLACTPAATAEVWIVLANRMDM